MNREIKQLYDGLDQVRKKNIRSFFPQAPKMLRYLDLLEQDELVKTNKAVHYIYQDEADSISHNVLINRFYKLRSKLRWWLLTQMKNSPLCLTPEEQELAFLRLMVIKNEHVYAYEKLTVLEQKCWDNNLFEILPEVLNLIFKSIHAGEITSVEQQRAYLDKMELAHDLQATLQKIKHHINYLQPNIKEYPKIIDTLRRKIKKLKAYPRFAMMYHFAAFSGGVQQEDVVERTSNAMSRHLNQLNKLKEQFPDMPIVDFEPYHREKFELHFCMVEAVFWYYKQHKKKCFKAIQRRDLYFEKHPDFFAKTSNAELHNFIYFCMNAEQYDDALRYTKELEEFQQANPTTQLESPYYIYEMLIYIALFPQKKATRPRALLHQITDFLKTAGAASTWIYGSLAEWAVIHGYYEEGRQFLKHPPLIQLYENYGISIETDELLELVAQKDNIGLKAFVAKMKQLYQDNDRSKHRFHYKSLLNIAQHFLKG